MSNNKDLPANIHFSNNYYPATFGSDIRFSHFLLSMKKRCFQDLYNIQRCGYREG